MGINENRNSRAAGIAIGIEEDGAAEVKRLSLGENQIRRLIRLSPNC
jgi:hypothetical protein